MAQRKSAPTLTEKRVSVQFWVAPELRESFQRAVRDQERTVAQALRHHMAETVQATEKQAA